MTRRLTVSDPPPFRVYLDVHGVRLYSDSLHGEEALLTAVDALEPYLVGAQQWDPRHGRWREQ